MAQSNDKNWNRANTLFSKKASSADFALVGIPAYKTALSQTSAHKTPAAIRGALAKYSTLHGSSGVDLRDLTLTDLGDISLPDGPAGEKRVSAALSDARNHFKLLVAIGGDNSITYSLARALWKDLSQIGVITLDAHHDLRDGISNGSPIWRLIQAGLPGANIVQIGISDFANSREYSNRARELGITVITRAQMRKHSVEQIMKKALAIAGKGGREIYVDLDVDVCDRCVAPACPASVPGGISADEIRQVAFLSGADKRVRAIDITEIDATMDSVDQRTIRLGALLVLESAAGLASRN